jgi:transcriptional regulator with XRE-family HTH domain
MSQAELSRRLGWPQQTTSRRLSGSAPITVDDLAAIARELEIPMSSLMPEVPA